MQKLLDEYGDWICPHCLKVLHDHEDDNDCGEILDTDDDEEYDDEE